MDWHKSEAEKYDYAYRYEPCCPVFGDDRWKVWSRTFSPTSKNEKVLDVGCGFGFTIKAALADDYDIVGVDIAQYLKEYVWPQFGIQDYCQLAFADDMPFANDEFGIILCWGVLEHIPEEGIIPSLIEMKRVLKPKGLLCLMIGLKPYAVKIRGEEAHITLKPKRWWKARLTDLGFSIMEVPKLVAKVGNLGIMGTYEYRSV